jgi:hypothetical protein
MHLRKLDLPHPDGPIMAVILFSGIFKFIEVRTLFSP